jgi:hypothetical protein
MVLSAAFHLNERNWFESRIEARGGPVAREKASSGGFTEITDSHMCQSEIDSQEDISFSIVQTGRRRREERTSPEEASQKDREPRDGVHVDKSMVLTVRRRRNLGLWEEFASARIEVANKARGADYTRLRPEVKS